jgi:hypothetical protein
VGTSCPVVREPKSQAFEPNPLGLLRRELSATLEKQKCCCSQRSRVSILRGLVQNAIPPTRGKRHFNLPVMIRLSAEQQGKRGLLQRVKMYGFPTVFLRPLLIHPWRRPDERMIANLERLQAHARARDAIFPTATEFAAM